MDIEKKIYNYLGLLSDAHNDMLELDDGFLDRNSILVITVLLKKPYKKWTSKMAFNGWKILEKYQDELKSYKINFHDIKRPDYIEEVKISPNDNNIFKIVQNKFIIEKPTLNIKKILNIENKENENFISFDFNLSNIYKIIFLIKENEIKVNKEYFKFINMYLNIIPSDQMFDGFSMEMKKNFNFELKPFQAIGCLFSILNKRILLGDEMGLGKTIQSIATIEIANLKPALIICPKNLKLNWESEISNSLINKKIEFLNSKSSLDADFYITNYESLHKNISIIKNIKPKSIVLDESHYLKNEDAKRTKTSLSIINNIEYRFSLTGTAILKTPVDLISQLRILNNLDAFGGETNYIENFCGNSNTKWGKDIRKGSSNLSMLNRRLRETCFLRRHKSDVIKDLPEKTRSYIYMEINKKKYNETLKEFKNLSRQEKLLKIVKLRQITAREKMESVKEWIYNFQESEKKLVVFAYHNEIQQELLKEYPSAAKILSGMSDKERDDNKNKFMEDPECKIIICSLKSASTGLTLTAGSDVLFVEMDWCVSNNIQAEDRCHRIGQLNAVNIWYIIAKGTIEEYIHQVVERKRDLIDKIYNSDKDDLKLIEIETTIIEDIVN